MSWVFRAALLGAPTDYQCVRNEKYQVIMLSGECESSVISIDECSATSMDHTQECLL